MRLMFLFSLACVAIAVLGCGDGSSTNTKQEQAIRDLQATVAALQMQPTATKPVATPSAVDMTRALPVQGECPVEQPVRATTTRQAFAPDDPAYADARPVLCFRSLDDAVAAGNRVGPVSTPAFARTTPIPLTATSRALVAPTQASVITVQPTRALLQQGAAATVGDLRVAFTGSRFEPPGRAGSLFEVAKPGTAMLVLTFTVTNVSHHRAASSEFRVSVGRLIDGATIYNNVHEPILIFTADFHPTLEDQSLDGALQPGEALSGLTLREVLIGDAPWVVRWLDLDGASAAWLVNATP